MRLLLACFVLNLLNLGGEFAFTEQGSNLVAGLEL